jgi:hypothetical protein
MSDHSAVGTTESASVPAPYPAADRAPAPAGAPASAPGRRAADVPGGRAASAKATDRTLNLLLHAAERDVRIGLTVAIDGLVVSGTLVGTVAYCRALADQFIADAGGTGMDEEFAESFHALVDDAYGAAHGDRRQPSDPDAYDQAVQFVHLADARYVNGSEILPHGRRGVLWRGRACDVTGWSLGELIPK